MKVSVIIPTYNRAKVISRAAQSVLDQTVSDLELIIVDDRSSDDTEEEVRKLQAKDERVIYIKHEENRGGSSARNTGIGQAQGEYLAFLDSDDEWWPEKLEKQLKKFSESSPDDPGVVYCWKTIEKAGVSREPIKVAQNFKGDLLELFLSGTGISTSTLLLKREVVEECGVFDPALDRLGGQDIDFCIKIARKYSFDCVDSYLVRKFIYQDNISNLKNASRMIESRKYILKKYSREYQEHSRARSKMLRHIGTYYIFCDDISKARQYFVRAIRAYPWKARTYFNFIISLGGLTVYKKIFNRKRSY